jgi:hypothetical protein
MREVSDDFLLQMAEVSGGLTGLFLLGVFFFLETGFRRFGDTGEAFEPYFRASTRIVLLLFAIPLGLSFTLVVLDPVWSRILFALLSVALVAANIDTAIRVGAVQKITGSAGLLMTEVVGTAGVVVIVVVPWLLGGLDPTREDLAWSILLSFAIALISVFATVFAAFDLARSRQP